MVFGITQPRMRLVQQVHDRYSIFISDPRPLLPPDYLVRLSMLVLRPGRPPSLFLT